MKTELVTPEQPLQSTGELASEDFAQYSDRNEERCRRSNPAGLVGREATSGNDAVNMRMVLQVLSPCVQHGKKTDPGAQMFWIGGDLYKSLSAGLEQKIVENPLVLQSQGREIMRYRKDHMEVRRWKQIFSALSQPLLAGVGLALGAMPVSAGVVRNGLMATSRASVQMAAEGLRATVANSSQHFQLRPQIGRASCRERV